jgi:hypothetical protein
MASFQVNDHWDVVVNGQVIGDLDTMDFGDVRGRIVAERVRSPDAAA